MTAGWVQRQVGRWLLRLPLQRLWGGLAARPRGLLRLPAFWQRVGPLGMRVPRRLRQVRQVRAGAGQQAQVWMQVPGACGALPAARVRGQARGWCWRCPRLR